jgi:glutamyl-tRNA reductase
MELFLNNLTFHNCPVELREKTIFSSEQRHSMLRQMHAEERISEAVILETCNRLEFYLYAKKSFDCKRFLTGLIGQIKPDAVETWRKYSREMSGIDVARHLFEVACGLDSQMLGESQILSQVKSAYTESLDSRMSRFLFHHLFHSAFRAAKAVRTNTNINGGAASVGLAAVELAKREIDLSAAAAMVIGAGENAELVAKYLVKAVVGGLIIANRDKAKAQAVCSRLNTGEAIGLKELAGRLAEVDLVISSTASQEPILTYQTASKILAHRKRPLLIIDIAVPRDIEAKVGELECVRLYDIDDLGGLVRRSFSEGGRIIENEEKRKGEIDKARQIITDFTNEFAGWYSSLNLVPVISQLTRRGLELARSEAGRYAKNFGNDNSEKLRCFAESLVKKILHGPINFLKNGGDQQPSAEQLQAADLINKMFLSQNEPAVRSAAQNGRSQQ